MSVTPALVAGTITVASSGGGRTWQNTGNVNSNDATYMTVASPGSLDTSLFDPDNYTEYWWGTNFGASAYIGASDTLNSRTLTIRGKAGGASSVKLFAQQIVGGVLVGDVLELGFLTTSDQDYSGSFTGYSLTTAEARASTTGVAFYALNGNAGATRTVSIDYVNLQYNYTAAGGGIAKLVNGGLVSSKLINGGLAG